MHADREIRSIDQSAVIIGNSAPNLVYFRLPSGGADNERDPGTRTTFGVFRDCVPNRKVDRHIAHGQSVYQIVDTSGGMVDVDRDRNFVALLGSELAHEPAHCPVSDKSYFHKLFTRSTYRSTA